MVPLAESSPQHAVTLELGGSARLVIEAAGEGRVAITRWSEGMPVSPPLHITEAELIALLQKSIRAGLLSKDFLMNLLAEFEI